MEIYLARHTSVNVPTGIAYGWADVTVNDTFEEEAAKVKEQLEGIGFDKVMTSPLQRCTQLATYCGYPEAERNELLKEIHFGEWEMMSWDQIAKDPRSKAWFDDWQHLSPPGGESLSDQIRRTRTVLESLRSQGYRRVCLFAHGGTILTARFVCGEVSLQNLFEQTPAYGSVVKVIF